MKLRSFGQTAVALAALLLQLRASLAAPRPANVVEALMEDVKEHPTQYITGGSVGMLLGMGYGAIANWVHNNPHLARLQTEDIERLQREVQRQADAKLQLRFLKRVTRNDGQPLPRYMLTFVREDGALPEALTNDAELMDCLAENLNLDGWNGKTFELTSVRMIDFEEELKDCMRRRSRIDPQRLSELLPVSSKDDVLLRARIIPRNDDGGTAPVPPANLFSREKLGTHARRAGQSFLMSVGASPLPRQTAAFGAPGSATGRRAGGIGIRLPRVGKF